ncbi:MAG: FecCD family ABC transporter permease [Planctomycetota bacterium]|jgi:iron complex transport system permease protein
MKGKALLFVVLVFLCVSAAAAALLLGRGLPPGPSLDALVSPGGEDLSATIVWKLRLPRLLLGLLVGSALAGAGCIFQGMLRNPLADPFTLGISGGGALGHTALVVIFTSASPYLEPAAAFLGALGAAVLVYAAASRARFTEAGLVLTGVILSFFFSSLVYLLFAFARPDQAHRALLRLMGDLSGAGPSLLTAAAVPVALSLAGLWVFSRDLNALTLGDEKARSLGVAPLRTRKILFALASLGTGAAVAVSGIIGFVGLMVPHFLRPFTGPDHRILLPASILGGAAFLAWADTLARWGRNLPVGVITGLLGGLFMLGLLGRRRGFRFF